MQPIFHIMTKEYTPGRGRPRLSQCLPGSILARPRTPCTASVANPLDLPSRPPGTVNRNPECSVCMESSFQPFRSSRDLLRFCAAQWEGTRNVTFLNQRMTSAEQSRSSFGNRTTSNSSGVGQARWRPPSTGTSPFRLPSCGAQPLGLRRRLVFRRGVATAAQPVSGVGKSVLRPLCERPAQNGGKGTL